MSEDALSQVLAGAGPILLDFDGPVCNIFAGCPADVVASELRDILLNSGAQLPAAMMVEVDPLQVLRWTATLGSEPLIQTIEDALRAAELRAATSATPTPYAQEVLLVAQQKGRRVAIASNNSGPAIRTYLDAHRLSQYVSYVVGRKPYCPEKMKPHPYSILDSLNNLNAEPHGSVLIGDSLTDITASHEAGIRVIGYANRPGKRESLSAAGADAVVATMAEVANALNLTDRLAG
jgi:phosphoglycolate phosphatase-like HAD superfamily hydrolase